MKRTSYLGARIGALAAFAWLALPAACSNAKDTLLDAPIPTIIDPSSVQSADGAEALRIGALGRLRQISAGSGAGDSPWMFAGLLTDEWKSSDTFLERNQADQRAVLENNANLNPVFRDLFRARTSAREAINGLNTYKPTPSANIGQMYLVMGIAETYLGEWFCNGIPLGDASSGAPQYGDKQLSNAEIFAVALAHLDSGIALVKETDANAVSIKNALLVARGRVLVDLGRFADAATAVAPVPTSYQLLATFSLTSGSNQIWSLNTSAKRWTVGDSVDAGGPIKNAIPFASAKDPRVPVTGSSTGTSAAGRGFDNSTNFITVNLWGRTDPTAIVSGLDARLIEAEAKLKGNDIAGMMSILNALRAAPQNIGQVAGTAVNSPVMAPLATPATTADAVTLYFREKAFWTYARGQRLGDLRRLIRQYGRTQDAVFPSGTFFKGGSYGTDVNFPIHVDEQNNPNYKACTDRNA